MQSIFRLPWCSDQVAPKLSDKMSFESLRASPKVEIPGLSKLKRKRVLSPEVGSMARSLPAKKPRPDQIRLSQKSDREIPTGYVLPTTVTDQPITASATVETPPQTLVDSFTDVSMLPIDRPIKPSQLEPVARPAENLLPDSNVVTTTDLSPLQQVIENEFNMQILLKHNELRLIEQELAKCQIALEQLRRCEIKPYPGAEGLSPGVTSGVGPAIAPPHGYTRPSHPPPYGVMDGPYSRHYRQWLLPDTQFDSIPISVAMQMEQTASMHARSTRNNGSVRKPLSKSFSLPTAREPLPGMPNYPSPAPRDKSAPLVLRRSTDGQLVKLICNNCLRGNFSSIQGFLNHCRIAHKVDYKSHDAAAIDCGRVLDESETANLSAETANVPQPKPAPTTRVQSAHSTPFKNLVHPMNLSNQNRVSATIPPPTSLAPRRPIEDNAALLAQSLPQSTPTFQPSAQAPRLSAHFAKFKLGGDLQGAVTSAKERIDITHADDEMDYSECSTPVSPSRPMPSVRLDSNMLGRPVSRKGQREPMQRPRPSPLMPVVRGRDCVMLDSPPAHTPNLSPHASDSNPGLVSDHEDDDHASGSEDEAPQSAGLAHSLPVRRDCSDNMDLDVVVEDDIDEHGVVIRRSSMFGPDDTTLRSAAGSPSRSHAVSKSHGR